MYILDCRGKWTQNCALNHYTIIQLEHIANGLTNGMKFITLRHFFSSHNRASQGTENCLMVQKREVSSKTFPDRKQAEKESEEIRLINALNTGDTGLVAGGPL